MQYMILSLNIPNAVPTALPPSHDMRARIGE
jgi:hypothetical protein